MKYPDSMEEKTINCTEFEELLTDYLDSVLGSKTHKAVAAHALKCPLCHSLLNEVKEALEICHEIAVPKPQLTKLEARILSMTMPETAIACEEFEEYLTDYLDGFLPAAIFHRWERHAVLCQNCTDLPGEVVRSIAACYTYKSEELPLPAGLHERILQSTIGTETASEVRSPLTSRIYEWARSLSFPVSVPQLAPVAMMLIFAVFVMTQAVSADGSITGMYAKSFELAERTYQQSADILGGQQGQEQPENKQEPVEGTFVNGDK